ncbi:MAG: glycosyltransferase family 9 protein [Candidatus Eisenbacteria bacterium]
MAATKTARELLPEAPSILAIETGLLGELLVITPALRAVKATWPEASITVMVSPGSAPVLVENPNVDRLLPLSKKERSGFTGLMRLASWIRAKRFDAVLVFHTSFRSALAAFMGAVPVRAGLAWEGRGFLLTHKRPRDRSAYEADEHLRVAELIGATARGRELELFLTDDERSEAASLLPDGQGRSLVCLHPGSSHENRRWPAERFAELGARLRGSRGVDPVYAVGPRERNVAEAVERWYEQSRLNRPTVIHPRTVRILGGVFERSCAVVTNDTGPMHVAAAVGVPGVFLHGPIPVERWHPPGERYVTLVADAVHCQPCDTSQCAQTSLLCMEAIDVDTVFEALSRLIESASPFPRRAGIPDAIRVSTDSESP